MESPSKSEPETVNLETVDLETADLKTLSKEELDKLERQLQEETRGAVEKIAALEIEQKELDAQLEELRPRMQQVEAELKSKGYKIENDQVVPIVDLEPLRKWAVAANAQAAKGWLDIRDRVERCETAFNLRIGGVMKILQSQPGQDAVFAELLQKYLTGGSAEDICDPAKPEDYEISEDGKETGEETGEETAEETAEEEWLMVVRTRTW